MCHQIVAVDCYVIMESYWTLFSTNSGNQKCHTGNPVKCTRLFFSQMAHRRYDIPLEMFQTENIYQTAWCHNPKDNSLIFTLIKTSNLIHLKLIVQQVNNKGRQNCHCLLLSGGRNLFLKNVLSVSVAWGTKVNGTLGEMFYLHMLLHLDFLLLFVNFSYL